MGEQSNHSLAPVSGPEKATFRWNRLLAWVPLAALLGLLVARAAVVAESYFAPFLIFPLIVGVILGGTTVLAMRVVQVGHRPTIWLGAAAAAMVAIAGRQYFSFQRHLRDWARNPKFPEIQFVAPERVPPPRFYEYLKWSETRGWPIGSYTAHGGLYWLAWSMDALLILPPALVLVGATARLPYCSRCRRWYQTMRSGRLDPDTAETLAMMVGIIPRRQEPLAAENSAASPNARRNLDRNPVIFPRARYRLLACQGGCALTGFVLSWDGPVGRLSSGIVWLDAAGRDRVVEILDRSRPRDVEETATADDALRDSENQSSEMGP